MTRTAVETANILSNLYDETFGRDSFEPFRITWPQLRSLAAVPRLDNTYLKDISVALSETERTLIQVVNIPISLRSLLDFRGHAAGISIATQCISKIYGELLFRVEILNMHLVQFFGYFGNFGRYECEHR